VADPVAVEEKVAGAVVVVDAEQAETATQANTVKAPQPAAVSLALSTVPAMVVRTFMEPPRGSGRWPPCFPDPASETFPDPGRRNVGEGKRAVVPARPEGESATTPASHKERPMDGADRQWRAQHGNIRLRE
jgi:hypothetical protein